jgi:hypothetical protein
MFLFDVIHTVPSLFHFEAVSRRRPLLLMIVKGLILADPGDCQPSISCSVLFRFLAKSSY